MTGPRLGFFSRLLEPVPAADRYRFALEQIDQAERSGFASAWVAQHHFGEDEGGLPSPFVLLAAAAQRTAEPAFKDGLLSLSDVEARHVSRHQQSAAASPVELSGGYEPMPIPSHLRTSPMRTSTGFASKSDPLLLA